MDVLTTGSRTEYFDTQIAASKNKFAYCKVSIKCVLRFKEVISNGRAQHVADGPILCLGTRNAREIDLFRIVFFGNPSRVLIARLLETRSYGFTSYVSHIESFGKSDINNIDNESVIGVELNPDGKRKDVLTASFDELPAEWTNKFKIIYANTLDHAQDPFKASKEWNRVVRPGGYIILGNGGTSQPTQIGCVGNITLEDIRRLFPGDLIYYNKYGNRYEDIIIKKSL